MQKLFQNKELSLEKAYSFQIAEQIAFNQFIALFRISLNNFFLKIIHNANQTLKIFSLKEKNFYSFLCISHLSHPNVLFCSYNFEIDINEENYSLFLVERFPYGSIRNFVEKFQKTDNHLILGLVHEVAQGLHYLHNNTPKIVYNNLKMSSIKIGSDGKLKLADFYFYQIDDKTAEFKRKLREEIFKFGILIFCFYFGIKEDDVIEYEVIPKIEKELERSKDNEKLMILLKKMFNDPDINAFSILDYLLTINIDSSIYYISEIENKMIKHYNFASFSGKTENKQNKRTPIKLAKNKVMNYIKKKSYYLDETFYLEYCISKLFKDKAIAPNEKYIRKLIIFSWQNKDNIILTFKSIIKKLNSSNFKNLNIILRLLFFFIKYLRKGSPEILENYRTFKKEKGNLIKTIYKNFNNLNENYNLIKELSFFILMKIKFLKKYEKYIDGNYSLQKYFHSITEQFKGEIIFSSLIEDLSEIITILLKLQSYINDNMEENRLIVHFSNNLLEESIEAFSLYLHLFVVQKVALCFNFDDLPIRKIMNEELENDLEHFIYKLNSFVYVSNCKNDNCSLFKFIDFSLINFIKDEHDNLKFEKDEFKILSLLNKQNTIFNIRLPKSYGYINMKLLTEKQILKTKKTTNIKFLRSASLDITVNKNEKAKKRITFNKTKLKKHSLQEFTKNRFPPENLLIDKKTNISISLLDDGANTTLDYQEKNDMNEKINKKTSIDDDLIYFSNEKFHLSEFDKIFGNSTTEEKIYENNIKLSTPSFTKNDLIINQLIGQGSTCNVYSGLLFQKKVGNLKFIKITSKINIFKAS